MQLQSWLSVILLAIKSCTSYRNIHFNNMLILAVLLQGARCLLDWADWSQVLVGQRVLELGSGLGQVYPVIIDFLCQLCELEACFHDIEKINT